MTNRKKVSIRPSDAQGDKLATTLGGMVFADAVQSVKWKAIGRREDSRRDTEAPVYLLKQVYYSISPPGKSVNYVERIVSVGGCDLVRSCPWVKMVGSVKAGLSLNMGKTENYRFHHRASELLNLRKFSWDAPVQLDSRVHLEIWSPVILSVYSGASAALVAPTTAIIQAYECQWLLKDGVTLSKVERECLEDAWSSWEQRCQQFIDRGERLIKTVEPGWKSVFERKK